ncbi:hypothetical protein [Romboutsia lituseburensis]|uniref:Uncharacterized protein n=1 Tax=Romboutsia lituseburensis DSM 797 TaxID=1121325 RepID=A0A1G9PG13_9FIRM|nr:hypothetical protein [Romboutsia lituseburensis]CEH33352.1 Hypothetical protein RLITU_0747 [Romboutsia lituseburensis]SDL97157.1 hypothetical protein SAMN04515677_104327 [Romboutsia lituseburensis DSM 797]
MKINLKNKKVRAAIVATVVILVPLGGVFVWGYGQANFIENDYVDIESDVRVIKDTAIERNDIILKSQADILKYINDKKTLENIDTKTKELIELSEFSESTSDTNKRIDMINEVNKDVNKVLVELYKNEKVKQDEKLSKSIESIEELDYSIDGIIKELAVGSLKEYNERLNKFPVKSYAEKRNMEKINIIKN